MRKFHGKLQTVLLTLLTLALIAGAVFATSAFAATADASDTNDASTWWIWVLLAVVIILNIVIILLLLLRGKDEEQTTAETEDTPRESEPADEEHAEEGDEDETSDEEETLDEDEPNEEDSDEEESVEEKETPEETEEKETFDEEDTLDEEETLDEDETLDENAAESTENDDEEEPFAATVAQKTQSDEEAPFALPTIEGKTMVLDKSFEAHLSQADESVKNLYDAITTELLSYKNVRCRTSWKFQAFYKGRRKCAMLQLRGKKLCLYLALDAANLAPKYHAKDVSGKARYQQVPTLVSVSGKRALQYAQQLVTMMMTELGAERGTTPAATPIPYKSTQTLIDEGLIKYKAAGRGFPRTTARSTAAEQTPTDESDDEKD